MENEKNEVNLDTETQEPEIEQTDEKSSEKDFEQMFEDQRRRAEKAEALLKEKESSLKEEKKTPKNSKEGFGYGEKAYLNSLGFTDASEQAFIEAEVASTGKSLDEVASFQYVKEHINGMRTDSQNADATPKANKRGNSSARDSVDYWIKKGELPQGHENTELRRKVVNQKIKDAKNKSKFGDGKFEVQ